MTHCKGCGVIMQTSQSASVGFVVSLEHEYCQRCFRLKHYGDVTQINKDSVSKEFVFQRVSDEPGLIVWITDVIDLENGFLDGLMRHLNDRDLLVVVNKLDLLPPTFDFRKLDQRLHDLFQEHALPHVKVALLGDHGQKGKQSFIQQLKTSGHQRFIFMGNTNVGKSTIINALCENNSITLSPYPHTTLDFIEQKLDYGSVVDTPGIQHPSKLLLNIPINDYMNYIWTHKIRPITIQLKGGQSFILPYVGICRVKTSTSASITLYFPKPSLIHRSSIKNLEAYIQRHPKGLQDLKHVSLKVPSFNFDVVFKSIGWYSFRGEIEDLSVDTTSRSDILLRKALI